MAEKIVIQVQADTTQAVKGIDKVDESIKDVNKSSEETTNSLDKMSGGAISGFKGITKSVGTAIKGFKSLKFAIAATGIGALIIAITAVGQAFTRSEEGQNKFAKLMGVIGAVTGQFMDAIAGLGDLIIGVFENPKQALTNFANLIKDNIVNRFEGLLELVPQLGKAIGLLFEGKFKEAGKTATNAVAKVTLGVEDIVDKTQQAIDKTNEFIQATVEEGEIAGKIADQRAKADKVDRELLVERAEANRKIAELREQAADKENVSLEKRLEAIKEAGQIEADITQKEKEAAKLRLEAKQAENALGLSTKADLEEEAQLKAQVINLETNRLRTQKALTAELTTAIREQAAERKAIQAEEDAAEKERKDRIAAEDKEREETQLKEKEERDARIVAGQQQTDAMLTQSKAQAVDAAISLFGAETAAGKAALIAKQLLAAEEMISEARKTITFSSLVAARSTAAVAEGTAQTAKIGFPQNIPMLIGYALQAVGIIGAISSAVGKSKSVASSLGGGGGGSTPSITRPSAPTSAPPAFNIVGAGAGNQLAETIAGQNERPIKAFVTSQDVTTAQSLERNIVEGASI
jgi:hypothetical protein